MVKTTLNLNFAWDTYAPPDFLIYVYHNHGDKVKQRWMESGLWNNIKFDYKKVGKLHIVNSYGLMTKTEIIEVSKLNSKHYFMKTYVSVKLLFLDVSGFIHTNFVSNGVQTTVRISGSKVFTGLPALVVKLFKNRIEKFASKLYADVPIEDDIIGQMWTNQGIIESDFPELIAKRIEARGSFDDLIEFDKYHDSTEIDILKFIEENDGVLTAGRFALHFKISIADAKEKLNDFIEKGECYFDENDNAYIFPDFQTRGGKNPSEPLNRLEKRLESLEDWVKIKLVASHQIIDADPEMAVVRAGKTTEAIVRDIYSKHCDDGEPNVSTMIRKLSTDGSIPEHITSWMHTVRSLRNVAVHGDGIDKTQALDALNAALNVAEWHMGQLKSEK